MTQPPAGWYPDPQASATAVRWWDGQRWTEHAQTTFRGPVTEDGVPLAGWWQRVGQYVIDSLIVQAVLLPLSITVQIHLMSSMSRMQSDLLEQADSGEQVDMSRFWNDYLDTFGPAMAIISAAGAALFIIYGAICLRLEGGTAGMRALRIRVRTVEPRDGRLPGGVVARRLLAPFGPSLVVAACFLLSWPVILVAVGILSLWGWLDPLWATWDKRNQTLHDKIAGTVMVRLR